MDCKELAANLQLLIDGELSDEAICEIRNHLDACTGCEEKVKAETLFKQILKDKICKKCPPEALVDNVRSSVLAHAL